MRPNGKVCLRCLRRDRRDSTHTTAKLTPTHLRDSVIGFVQRFAVASLADQGRKRALPLLGHRKPVSIVPLDKSTKHHSRHGHACDGGTLSGCLAFTATNRPSGWWRHCTKIENKCYAISPL